MSDACVPVIDCPECGAKDSPMSYEGTYTKKGHPDIVLWTCSACGKVANITHDIIIKRWITAEELEAMGYSKE